MSERRGRDADAEEDEEPEPTGLYLYGAVVMVLHGGVVIDSMSSMVGGCGIQHIC